MSVCVFGVLVDSLMSLFIPVTGANAVLCCSSSSAVEFYIENLNLAHFNIGHSQESAL